jgi:predicted thioredoxin/glutaredoxin
MGFGAYFFISKSKKRFTEFKENVMLNQAKCTLNKKVRNVLRKERINVISTSDFRGLSKRSRNVLKR